MDNSTNENAQTPPPGQAAGKKTSGRLILIVIAVVLVVGGIALFVLGTQNDDGIELLASPTPAIEAPLATPGSTPTATPEAELQERTEVSIEVLNGTGIAGEAGFLQEELQDLGYDDIEVGNADTQDEDREVTTVTFSSELSAANADEIFERLEELYQEVERETSNDLDVDVSIVTGLREGTQSNTEQTASPSPTSAATGDEEE